MKGISDQYWNYNNDFSVYKSRIDIANATGADTYIVEITPTQITNYINGFPDYHQQAIDYAQLKGMKIYFNLNFIHWNGEVRETFMSNAVAQTNFKNAIIWILQRYPKLNCIELEEPENYSILTNSSLLWNPYFVQLKQIVDTYRQPGFIWAFNFISGNTFQECIMQGIDADYININRLFDTVRIQDARKTLIDFQYEISRWKAKFTNLHVEVYIYINSLVSPCTGTECWNQFLFDELKWTNQIQQPIIIFEEGALKISSIYWPNDPTPGATAGDKIKSIWGSAPVPPPVVYGAPCGIVGDIDGDGNITQADVDLAESWLLSGIPLTADELLRIDVNGNGVADLGDLVLLKQYSLGQITTFPGCTSRFKCELPLNGFEIDQFGNRQVNTACDPVVVVPPAPSGGLEKMLVIVGGYLLVKEMFGGK